MKGSKLFLLLSALGDRELKRFKEFVFADFVNKNKKVRQLCTILLKALQGDPDKPLPKKKVYHQIFGGDEFNDLQLNNLIAQLLKIFHLFLGYSVYNESPLLRQNLIARSLIQREQYLHFDSVIRRYSQLIDQADYANYASFHSAYEYHEVLDHYSLSGDKRAINQSLQQKNDALDLYYFSNKLRIACDMYSRNNVINAGYEPTFIAEIMQRYEADKANYDQIPAIKLYLITMKMLTDEAEQDYFALKQYLEKHHPLFPPEELNTIYSYALNYCVRKINSGRSNFYAEIFSLYKALLAQQLLLNNGYLSQWDYTNIITAALRLQEFDWTDQFIQEYKKFLLPEEAFNVYTYNLTTLYFTKGDYDKALELLHEVEFTDPFYHAAAKIIQLKVYFEMGESEALFSLAEAFRQFLKRNKQLSAYQKLSNLNFIKATLWCYKSKLNSEFQTIEKSEAVHNAIWKKIQQLKPLANAAWLSEVSRLKG